MILKKKLKRNKEELQATREELESSNEELQSINEERYRIVFELCEETLWKYNIASETMIHSTKYNNNFLGDKIIVNYRQSMLNKENIHKDDIKNFNYFCDNLASEKQQIKLEMRSKDKYGEYTWFLIQGKTVFNNDGTPIKIIGKTSNINDSKKQQERLEKLAKLYPLTKILNYGKDTNSSINIVLSMIGKYYNISKVSIFEELPNKNITVTTYEWRKNRGTTKSGELRSVLIEKVKRYNGRFFNE